MRQGGRIVAAATVALLFVIGSVPVAADGPVADNRTTVRPDPDTDVIGWEAGYWHNESIAVDQTDGLSDAELDRYIARSMARVEFLRDREFKRSVSVTIQSRTEFQSRLDDRTRSDRYVAWHNQVWEALFIVGEDRNAQATLETIYRSSVLGFYTPGSESIRIITTTPSRPTLDNATLIHELTHALQDQYIGLTSEQFHRPTRDGRLAAEGIIEGEASYIARRYAQRCGRQWDCVASPARTDGGLQTDRNLGMLLTLYQPYSDGPVYIDHLRERGGWSAVANAYNRPPSSTEQTIHLTDTAPSSLTVDDTATDGWQRFDRYGDGGTETVGEAAIYAMFWYQSRYFDAPIVEWRSVRNVSSPLDVYDYRSRPSTGWANDRLIPYRRGDGSNASYGYVWVSVWDSRTDAREFRSAYLSMLAAHPSTRVGRSTWRLTDGPYADAYHVVQTGRRVTIVNAPTVGGLRTIRPGISVANGSRSTTPTMTVSTTARTTAGPDSTTTRATDGLPSPRSPTPRGASRTPGQPGFGFRPAAVGVLLLVLLGRWWSGRR